MDMSNFYKGLIIGFSIAAPVGPIGILCIKRTLTSGRKVGLASGMGAATADAFYGCVAAFGLTFISNFLIDQQNWLRLIGGTFLCYLGIKTFFSHPSDSSSLPNHLSLLNAYGSTFFLTLTNPMTILSFAAIFAGLGLAKVGGGYSSAIFTVIGVYLGSSCWWVLLSTSVHIFRAKIKPAGLYWINWISGLIILGFGIAALLGAL
ncbi:MAG: lysine transporter LysE [Chloroflexi bacterium RBG_19FT_COMBO_49_13]|nr:MAG: lysine transporter LysE [Chloroflexi bacterium RBG_19FT_COMBO_49_13]